MASSDRSCSVPNCSRRVYARGLCEPHYRRLQRTGRLQPEQPVGATQQPAECWVHECARTATERGLCHAHYLRVLRCGDSRAREPIGRRRNTTCCVESCGRDAYARQLCRNHYRRVMRTGSPQADKPIRDIPAAGYLLHGYFVVPVSPALRHLVNGATRAPETDATTGRGTWSCGTVRSRAASEPPTRWPTPSRC
jgi:hypothetical protein